MVILSCSSFVADMPKDIFALCFVNCKDAVMALGF